MGRKFNPEYIQKIEKLITEINLDEKEFDDYTQICLSLQDAVRAASTIFGCHTDEEKHKMAGFIHELSYCVITKLREFDITFKRKEG